MGLGTGREKGSQTTVGLAHVQRWLVAPLLASPRLAPSTLPIHPPLPLPPWPGPSRTPSSQHAVHARQQRLALTAGFCARPINFLLASTHLVRFFFFYPAERARAASLDFFRRETRNVALMHSGQRHCHPVKATVSALSGCVRPPFPVAATLWHRS